MKRLFWILALVACDVGLKAEEAQGFQASLSPDIAIYPKTTEIRGLSLSIWGQNPQHALALGFVNGSTGESSGFSLGFLANSADSYTGVEWSLVNLSNTSFVGWQAGLVNDSRGEFIGFQSGCVNLAQECHGVQLGLVNYSEILDGVQIGLANIAMKNPWFSDFPDKLATGFPIVNWSF